MTSFSHIRTPRTIPLMAAAGGGGPRWDHDDDRDVTVTRTFGPVFLRKAMDLTVPSAVTRFDKVDWKAIDKILADLEAFGSSSDENTHVFLSHQDSGDVRAMARSFLS